LDLSSPPVSLAGSIPVPARLFLIKLINVDSRDVQNCAEKNIPVVQHSPVLQVVTRPLFIPGINPAPTGNRRGESKKPATESTFVQGTLKPEELSFRD